jgi:acyl carrier protein
MDNDRLIAAIVDTARTVFKEPTLDFIPSLMFQDIRGFDSVLAVQYILAIEEAFDIMLTEYEVDHIDTMGALLKLLEAKTNA